MRLTLVQEQTISELGRHLYHFLPGQAHPYADQSISFQGAANATHLGQFWQGGSKQPAIVALLRATLEDKVESFCDLINEIVRKALPYRNNKGSPVTREDIRTLNDLLLKLNFKIPELRNPKFLDGLPSASKTVVAAALSDAKRRELLTQLQKLAGLAPQPRGYAFEESIFSSSKASSKAARTSNGARINFGLFCNVLMIWVRDCPTPTSNSASAGVGITI
jgi:hypothetical protein